MVPHKIMSSPKRLARIAGVLYLLVGIFGGFAEGFVDPKMYVAGNAAATAGNVVANAGLVRMGVVAHLLDGTFFVFLAMALYVLLEHVHKSVARAMLVLVALATGIICLNAVFQFEGLRVATDSSYAAAFGTAGSNALVLLLLDTQHYGTLIAQVFFGLWLVPLGYLAYKSGLFPKWLGVLLIVGGVCYLVDLLAAFLVPDFGQKIHAFVVIPSRNRGNLDGPVPARGWREDREARRAHPCRGVSGPRADVASGVSRPERPGATFRPCGPRCRIRTGPGLRRGPARGSCRRRRDPCTTPSRTR